MITRIERSWIEVLDRCRSRVHDLELRTEKWRKKRLERLGRVSLKFLPSCKVELLETHPEEKGTQEMDRECVGEEAD